MQPFCKYLFLLTACGFLLLSCSVTRNYNPDKKYSPQELTEDLSTLRNILETKHPSLYWYTPKDSMDYFFNVSGISIRDSMTENQFAWFTLAPLIAKIHCGHTSLMRSRSWEKFVRNKMIPTFPLFMKVWKDTMMVVGSINRDSLVPRGSFVTAINGIPVKRIENVLFQYMPTDGYEENLNYIKLSADFPYYFRNVFGLFPFYKINFTDSTGISKETMIPWWYPKIDSSLENKKEKRPRLSRTEKMHQYRSIKTDSTVAVIDLNAFTKGNLNSFFRKSFREIKKKNIQNLILDLRVNGGGEINKAVRLAKYILDKPFVVADSAYSISKNFNPYGKYIGKSFWNNLALLFITKKRADGKFHFGYWEQHQFKPKKKFHFDGQVYILTNGLTFSAGSLFCDFAKGQKNVTLVGENTGGGWYGNSGILIPDITLPKTGLRVRLPFFRLIAPHHPAEKGTGVMPDWYIGPNWRDVLSGRDTKMEDVLQYIRQGKNNGTD